MPWPPVAVCCGRRLRSTWVCIFPWCMSARVTPDSVHTCRQHLEEQHLSFTSLLKKKMNKLLEVVQKKRFCDTDLSTFVPRLIQSLVPLYLHILYIPVSMRMWVCVCVCVHLVESLSEQIKEKTKKQVDEFQKCFNAGTISTESQYFLSKSYCMYFQLWPKWLMNGAIAYYVIFIQCCEILWRRMVGEFFKLGKIYIFLLF